MQTETNRLYYGLPIETPCKSFRCERARLLGRDGEIKYGPYCRRLCEDHFRGHLHCLTTEREREVARALRGDGDGSIPTPGLRRLSGEEGISMSTPYTHGPWARSGLTIRADEVSIARCAMNYASDVSGDEAWNADGPLEAEAFANATLIAAAPALANALVAITAICDADVAHLPADLNKLELVSEAARAALAQARRAGEE